VIQLAFEIGEHAYAVETRIHKWRRRRKYEPARRPDEMPRGGYTETLGAEHQQEFIGALRAFAVNYSPIVELWPAEFPPQPPERAVVASCSVEWCGGKAVGHGLCRQHFERLLQTEGMTLRARPIGKGGICAAPGCQERAQVTDLCRPHYRLKRRYGSFEPRPMRTRGVCLVEGCRKPRVGRGLCGTHYARLRRNGSPDLQAARPKVACSVEGCAKMAVARGLCGTHYGQVWRRAQLS
jgi:hypothetical protein